MNDEQLIHRRRLVQRIVGGASVLVLMALYVWLIIDKHAHPPKFVDDGVFPLPWDVLSIALHYISTGWPPLGYIPVACIFFGVFLLIRPGMRFGASIAVFFLIPSALLLLGDILFPF